MTRISKADREATRTVAAWAAAANERAARGCISDPDCRLVPVDYEAAGMGTRVVTMRDGNHVAWFDDRRAALLAIQAVTR